MPNLLSEGLPTLQPQTELRSLACMRSTQCPPPLSPLPLFSYLWGLVPPRGPYYVLSSFCSIQCGMPESENLVLRAAPLFTPHVWGQWFHTTICPAGSLCKVSGSLPTSAHPEHRNSGRMQALSLPSLSLHPQPHILVYCPS